MPRIRDFRGLNPKSFDGHGNYAFGIKEQIIFPAINYDRIDKVRGMDIIVTTTARTDEEARELLRLFGFPFPAEAEKQAACAVCFIIEKRSEELTSELQTIMSTWY